MEFCPELQLDWSLDSVQFETLKEVKVTLVVSSPSEPPEHQGRHVSDVISWPSIYTQVNKTEFYFNSCEYFNVREEFSPWEGESDEADGKTFQRLLKSELLNRYKDRGQDNLLHYRIVTSDVIIDVISNSIPDIVKLN